MVATMRDNGLNFESLKTREQELRAGFEPHMAVRVHRCISWLGRAEVELDKEDYDAAFIFYWIAFNSIYSAERFYGNNFNEKDLFTDFFKTIIELDRSQTVYNAIWDRFSDSIRTLLKNKFVFQPFWEAVNGRSKNWEELFQRNNRQVLHAFRERDTVRVLSKLFDRLYVLRNQLMHGGATWKSRVNRQQVRDGSHILCFLVPIFVNIMMEHPQIPWSKPYYPVISD